MKWQFKEIIFVYNNHPSIEKIKNLLCVSENKYYLPYANTSDIIKIFKSLNVNKVKGPDGISQGQTHFFQKIFPLIAGPIVQIIEIANTLFDQHISSLCKKASNQLNAIGRIQKYMGLKEKDVFLNSFIVSNFNYLLSFCVAFLFFKMQERALRILYITTLPVIIINF